MFDLAYLAIILLIGYGFGTYLESRHYRSIREREAALQGRALVFNSRVLPPLEGNEQVRLLAGSTVVSVDAFKRFAAKIHSFFGGQVTAYESLLDRARREATLRLREKADEMGATMIFGFRIESASINNGDPRATTGVELVAYGTAIIPANRPPVADANV